MLDGQHVQLQSDYSSAKNFKVNELVKPENRIKSYLLQSYKRNFIINMEEKEGDRKRRFDYSQRAQET